MKRPLSFLIFLLSCMAALAAESTFSSTLAPEELRQAGIDGLQPEQLARLDALVERYTHGEVDRGVTEVIEEKEDKESLGNPRKGPKLIEARIIGRFQGWGGGTIFRLENGQIWQQANPESYKASKPVMNPGVVLKKSKIGGYWMHVEGFPGVRVRRIE